jgi:transcriptional regulator with XRE-family HTH domain
MSHWAKPDEWVEDAVDLDIVEETALAMAQSAIQTAIDKSGISRTEMARRMKCNRSLVSRLLSGSHNLTVKTMARSMAVCGFEVRFEQTVLEWNWGELAAPQEDEVPANAGTTMLKTDVVSIVVPALAASGGSA